MKKLTIRLRIIISFALVVSLLLVVSAISLYGLQGLGRAMSVVTEETTPIVVVGGQLTTAVLEANRTAVEHTGMHSTDRMGDLETGFEQLVERAGEHKLSLQSLTAQNTALAAQMSTLAEGHAEFAQLGAELFKGHRRALGLKQRVDELASDFEGTSDELLASIDARLEDAQGDLETIRTLYQLREANAGSTQTLLQAQVRRDLPAVETFADNIQAHTEKTSAHLAALEESDSIDSFDLQELADVLETYNASLSEPNRFFDLLRGQLRQERVNKDRLVAMNGVADGVVMTLKAIVEHGEQLSEEARSQAASTFAFSRVLLLAVSLISLLVAVSVGFLLMRAIQRPLSAAMSVLTTMADGDLRTRLEDSAHDEFGQLARNVNRLIDQLSTAIRGIIASSNTLYEHAVSSKALSDSTQREAGEQKTQTELAATAMTEVNATVSEIATSTEMTLAEIQKTNQGTQEGNATVSNAVAATGRLSEQIGVASETVHALVNKIESIGSILDVIKSIAEQTNLLALNAAIEAARAGDQGRGFAVVADEVRTLAVRTQQSTDEIEGMIHSLDEDAQRAMSTMGDSVDDAEKTATFVASAGRAFEAIAESMRTVFDMSSQIATAAEEQSVTTNEVAKNVHMIAEIAERTAASAVEVSERGDSLEGLAERLQAQVSHFTPGETVAD